MIRGCVCLVFLLPPQPAAAQEADVQAVLMQILAEAQVNSFRQQREFCGYLGRNARGDVVAGPTARGTRYDCIASWPEDLEVLVSWHTHADFHTGAWSEVPTLMDIHADADEGIDGYVATPGGRLWYVDTVNMTVRQVCPRGCVPSDPHFIEGFEGPVAISYTYRQLQQREAMQD